MLATLYVQGEDMNFTLTPLPFAEDALEPHISQRTVAVHYHKHHQGYLDKLHKALSKDKRRTMTLEETVRSSEGGVFNNAAQVWNHSFYWQSIAPGSKREPPARPFLKQIKADFGSLDAVIDHLLNWDFATENFARRADNCMVPCFVAPGRGRMLQLWLVVVT